MVRQVSATAVVVLLVIVTAWGIRNLIAPPPADNLPGDEGNFHTGSPLTQAYPLPDETPFKRMPYPLPGAEPVDGRMRVSEYEPFDGHATSAVIALDFQTLQPRAAYFSRQPVCRGSDQALDDERLKGIAAEFLVERMERLPNLTIRDEHEQRETIPFSLIRSGDLAVLEIESNDFGAAVILNVCSGKILFAGEIVWSGRGEQLFPDASYPQTALTPPTDLPD